MSSASAGVSSTVNLTFFTTARFLFVGVFAKCVAFLGATTFCSTVGCPLVLHFNFIVFCVGQCAIFF